MRLFTDRPEKPAGAEAGEVQVWFLAVFKSKTAYRLELALPIRCSDGQFVGWAERVFIDEIALDSEPKLDMLRRFLRRAAEATSPQARCKGRAGGEEESERQRPHPEVERAQTRREEEA